MYNFVLEQVDMFLGRNIFCYRRL